MYYIYKLLGTLTEQLEKILNILEPLTSQGKMET